ncbi:MAG TPA: type I DNA topoisomerase [Smithella sp.]|nr:MAG: DNA topoisomerase 1 [Deltaproteobacteria bacterium ADurb.Bin022]HOS15150.1 type I DNA topoisomerase [Smithella sp.]HPL47262.1 type I DNA topoisomerase [Smithella sp.]HQP41654.1 type I DNA topoisomerase [Smithella sp.]
MANSLVIVESPTKVKTIKKFLGNDFNAVASMGHIKDLPKSKLGIDLEKDFEPSYSIIETKKKTIDELKKAAKNAENIYLAPDPDREGEAIAWHINEVLNTKNKNVYRVLFNDLTKDTVTEAIKNPLQLDFNKYEAQQTRRILDRLVGYQISPVLWDKVKRGLSAGRVQSVAVRMICDREDEIKNFKPEEYWNLTAKFEGKNPPPFEAKLHKVDGKKAKVTNGEQAAMLADKIKQAEFFVEKLEKKEVKRTAPPPFTTSKLQQEASRWFRFSAKKTMMVAQKLYEGIELGKEGSVGLITYMRTDSYRISEEALKDVRDYIRESYSADYLPHKPHTYKNTQKAQDAHEAIRPSRMTNKPQDIKQYLSADQFKLYQLIWNRFVASQMNPAILDQTTIDIAGANCLFRAQGQIMKFPGFTIVYTEGKDDKDENGNGNGNGTDKFLPEVSEKEKLKLLHLNTEQKFTQPPPRFSEASLVRELEEKGIGRPSTYAAILSTIQEREYVKLEKGKFYPSELGMMVTHLLVKSFPTILEIAFTADMENKLDAIETGERKRVQTLKEFYALFADELKKAKAEMKNIKQEETPTDLVCEKCQSPMVIRWGKNGKFLCCSNYPKCKNTMNFTHDENGKVKHVETRTTDIKCNKCGKNMIVKEGRFGQFLACSGYPECKNTMTAAKDENGEIVAQATPTTDEVCELCGKPMTVKRGRYGQFLGCTGYPECKNIKKLDKDGKAAKQEVVLSDEVCELCGKPMAVKRGRYGQFLGCTGYPECKNIKKIPKTKTES